VAELVLDGRGTCASTCWCPPRASPPGAEHRGAQFVRRIVAVVRVLGRLDVVEEALVHVRAVQVDERREQRITDAGSQPGTTVRHAPTQARSAAALWSSGR